MNLCYNKAEKTKNWVQKPCSVTGEIRIEQVEEQEEISEETQDTFEISETSEEPSEETKEVIHNQLNDIKSGQKQN